MLRLKSLLLLVTPVSILCCCTNSQPIGGYYWRDFNGIIPNDAFVGAIGNKNTRIYVGQGLSMVGPTLAPSEIKQGQTVLTIAINNKLEKSSSALKILCGAQDEFYWLPTSGSTLQTDIKNKDVVIGGYSHQQGPFYVGRINFNNEYKISRIVPFDKTTGVRMNFGDDSKEHSTSKEFEVLIHKTENNNQRGCPSCCCSWS